MSFLSLTVEPPQPKSLSLSFILSWNCDFRDVAEAA